MPAYSAPSTQASFPWTNRILFFIIFTLVYYHLDCEIRAP
jgi:hypothetical protein